ncbi:hypothetical protein TL16_g01540 [Triparma laevis f. inornata]|uniref:BTB domain-containing protein n=1 Tax=Triparma laevis f. inornata TaxID=1714386 RepID=A0A9W6ZNQ2_9STRA|nr:hypothetical protein TL16_g01540 [Triparma laevis f. inornata]
MKSWSVISGSPLYERALEGHEKTLGKTHLDMLMTVMNIAIIYSVQTHYKKTIFSNIYFENYCDAFNFFISLNIKYVHTLKAVTASTISSIKKFEAEPLHPLVPPPASPPMSSSPPKSPLLPPSSTRPSSSKRPQNPPPTTSSVTWKTNPDSVRRRETKSDVRGDENVNFKVIAKSDLYLTGSERSLLRVKSGNTYSCLMTTQQKMSSLFRHYAKYHGLRKESLIFTYVEGERSGSDENLRLEEPFETQILKPADTPSLVGLKKDEEIWVREKEVEEESDMKIGEIGVKAEEGERQCNPTFASSSKLLATLAGWNRDMKMYLRDSPSDFNFLIGETKIGAHRVVVAARGGRDSILNGPKTKTGDVVIGVNSEYTVDAVKVVLEFIYTASVTSVLELADELAGSEGKIGKPIAMASILTEVIEMAKGWGFETLVEICEYGAIKSINADNVLQYLTTPPTKTSSPQTPLTKSCMQFIMENMKTVTNSESFQDQLTNNPTLIIPILRKAAESVPEKKGRKRKISETNTSKEF